MLDKLFETIARKQLQDNAIKKLGRKLDYRYYKAIGAIVKFPNGKEGLDVVKLNAANTKRSAIFTAATVGIGLAAGRLGSLNH
jgi:hypothetical protein